MIFAILSLSVFLAHAQDIPSVQSSTRTGQGFVDKMRVDGFDNSIRQLQNGNYIQTGKPTFQGGFNTNGPILINSASTFTATVNISSFSTITASATFTSDISISSAVTVKAGANFIYGAQSDANVLNVGQSAKWATSIDSVNLSSGCLVYAHINSSSGADSASYVFTSTTTGGINMLTNGDIPAVTIMSCNVGQKCLIGIAGIYRIKASAAISAQYVTSGSTKCQAGPDNNFDTAAIGLVNQVGGACSSGGFCWIKLR